MAEVQQNDSGGGGKNKQKKQTLRVDFTPMVDMNMLLITFFMLATSLLKPQMMDLNMPSKDKVTDAPPNVEKSDAITFLLGADNALYYYEGMIEEDGSSYDDPEFLKVSTFGADGIRQLLMRRNAAAYDQIQEMKIQLQNLDITEQVFNERSLELQKELRAQHKVPTIIIKPTEFATYKNVVDALDEMLITNIGGYALVDIDKGDRYLLYKRTGDTRYLDEEQKAELAL